MKATTCLISLALAAFANANFFGSQVVFEDEDLSIPGDNPLAYCKESKDDIPNFILQIEKVDLEPNPPEAGKTLTIKASGNFSEEITKGSYVNLSVKYGLIKIFTGKEDLCDQMKNIDKECPIEKGKTVIMKDVELPSSIPPGKYSVIADVYTHDNRKITCLAATVAFSR